MLATSVAESLLMEHNEEAYLMSLSLLNNQDFFFVSPITNKPILLEHKSGVIGIGTFFYSPSVTLDPRFDIQSQEQEILVTIDLDKITYTFYFININAVINHLFQCPIELLEKIQQGIKLSGSIITPSLLTIKSEESIDQLSKELVQYYKGLC